MMRDVVLQVVVMELVMPVRIVIVVQRIVRLAHVQKELIISVLAVLARAKRFASILTLVEIAPIKP
jgi:hypothetical protein